MDSKEKEALEKLALKIFKECEADGEPVTKEEAMELVQDLIETKQLTEKQKLLSYFFTYSFLGWILETVFCVLTLGVFNKRGFLYGPVCPIYGFGAIILIESLKKQNNYINI